MRPLLHDSNRKCPAFAARLPLRAKRCFDPQTPSTLFKGLCSARTMPMLHSASSMLCLWLEHRRCALWLRLLESVSNGESKIAKSKARLRYACARFFLGILPCSPSLAEGVRGWVVMSSEAKHDVAIKHKSLRHTFANRIEHALRKLLIEKLPRGIIAMRRVRKELVELLENPIFA